MRFVATPAILIFCAIPFITASGSLSAADDGEKPAPPTPAPPAPVHSLPQKPDKWELTPEWLAAIERLRLSPRPGQVVNAGISAGVADLFEVSAPVSEKIDKVVAAYDAERVKRAAKWNAEMLALRAEYEAKVVAELPEARRETAKKLLEFSHEKWQTPIEREAQFNKDFEEKLKDAREKSKNITPEQHAEQTEILRVWVRDQRAKLMKEDNDVIEGLRALLTPEEVQRLELFNRHRQAAPQPQPGDIKK